MVWLADYQAWGNTAKVVWREQVIDQMQVSQDELQPIRFQGQHFDTETGLHYNRFRYYDPDVGMFTTRDPIELMGGSNVFQYAPNPTEWIDPLGLSKGGKQNINTEGLNTNSDPAEVERRMNEAKKNGQQKRYSTLKGLLKVIRRNVNYKGGCCMVIPDEVLEQANDPCSLHEYSVECQKKRWYEKYGGT